MGKTSLARLGTSVSHTLGIILIAIWDGILSGT